MAEQPKLEFALGTNVDFGNFVLDMTLQSDEDRIIGARRDRRDGTNKCWVDFHTLNALRVSTHERSGVGPR